MLKNTAGQAIGAQMITAATGADFTGAVTVYVTIDAAAQVLGAVGGGLCTHEGNGYHTYRPSQAETNGDLLAFTFKGSGAISQTMQVATITAAQQAAVQAATGPLSSTVQTIVADALAEIGVTGAGQTPSGPEAAFVLGKLNRLFDNWNADRRAVYADLFTTYALTASLDPHTIGPNSATWTVTQRPVSIAGASLISGTSYFPIRMRGAAWWHGLHAPTATSSRPTDLYYEPSWPNGTLHFWPVPSSASSVRLHTRVTIGQVTLADSFWLPPGYRDAVTLTLAESIAPAFGKETTTQTREDALSARARIFANNDEPLYLGSDAPGGQGRSFHYRTGVFH